MDPGYTGYDFSANKGFQPVGWKDDRNFTIDLSLATALWKHLMGHPAHLGTAWCPSSKKHKMLKFMTGFDFLQSFVLFCNKRIITKHKNS